jgi:hypothetical protein
LFNDLINYSPCHCIITWHWLEKNCDDVAHLSSC